MGRLLTLGHVQRPHGVRGLLRVRLDLEDSTWLRPGMELLVGTTPRELSRFSAAPGGAPFYLIGCVGVDDRNQAEALKGEEISIDRSLLPELGDDDGFYIETGWTSINNKIKVPSKNSVWKLKDIIKF